MDIEKIWGKIKKYEGEIFFTIKSFPFSYRIENNYIIPIRNESEINRRIPKTDIIKTLMIWPISGPAEITNEIQGSSYVYGLLSDNRISCDLIT